MSIRLKTAEQVRRELNRKGVSLAAWARAHGVAADDVQDLLRGKTKGLRGAAHNVAVLLGLKDGELNPDAPGRP